MNKNMLKKDVQDFINENLNKPLDKVILKGSPFSTVTIKELATQIASKAKSRLKIPTWYKQDGIIFPPGLNLEQSSSEQTAMYKATLVSGKQLIDLTGGFGVDSFFFAKQVTHVVYCEHKKELAEIASHNFKCLTTENIAIKARDGIALISDGALQLDWIYLDPSRRTTDKRKVFLLEDCEPDILQHNQLLLNHSKNILLKTSPLLDISKAISTLKHVQEVHVVAVQGEVKELLFVLKKNPKKEINIIAVNLLPNKPNEKFQFIFPDVSPAILSKPQTYLFEPNAAILKSGGFNAISNQLNINKLHKHSHLYTSDTLISFPGRCMKIQHVIPYNKKIIKQIFKQKKGNITTRNFPDSVAQIRKKTGLKEGGNSYLFFTTDLNEKHIVIICEKV